MSRQPEVEAILQAWYDLENCEPSEKTERLKQFHQLLDDAITNADIQGVSRNELKELLGDSYAEFNPNSKVELHSSVVGQASSPRWCWQATALFPAQIIVGKMPAETGWKPAPLPAASEFGFKLAKRREERIRLSRLK